MAAESWRGLNKVAPYIYMGSFPPMGSDYGGAAAIIFCAEEKQPSAAGYPGVRVIHAGIDDDPTRPLRPTEIEKINAAVHEVERLVRAHQRVMITCAMGFNRSGLVTALALRRVYGMSGPEAIKTVRAARGDRALSNPVFATYVLTARG